MNRRELIKASAAGVAVALNIAGLRRTRAAANEVYIDPTVVGVGHAGTYADPYSTDDALVYFSLLAGDLANLRIRFRAGTTFVGYVSINGCDNYFLEPYGDGAAPIISNHVDVSSLTWMPDDGVWGGPAPDVYYLPASGTGSTWNAGDTAVIIDDGTGAKQCEYRLSYADLIGPLYPCSETAYPSGWPFLQWWDTTSSPHRMWIRGPAGWDPNAITVLRPVPSQGAMYLLAGSGVTVSDLDLQCGANVNLLAAGVSGLLLDHVDAHNCGGNPAAAEDVFNIIGTSKEQRATDIVLRSCRAFRSLQHTSSHGLEISWLRNVTIDDFEVRDIRFHGIEFWASNSDVTVRRMKARQTLTLMQFQPGEAIEADTLHDNIVVQNCECVQRASYLRHGSSGPNGGNGIVVCDSSRNRKFVSDLRIYENSLDLDSGHFLYAFINENAGSGLGNNAVTFKGNVCRLSQLTSDAGGLYCCAVDTAAAEWTMDRNVYQFAANPTNKLAVAGGYASDLAGYQALWDAVGPITNADNSVVADAAAPLYKVPGGTVQTADLSLIDESVAAVGLGDPADAYTPATDILGAVRDSAPDAGAYEYFPPDTDGDGIADAEDNCTLVANPSQCDSDGDGYGNLCDGDLDNNGFTNVQDYAQFRAELGAPSTPPSFNVADLNCNSAVNAQDYAIFRRLLGLPPGPSG